MEVGSTFGEWKCDRVLGKGNFGVVTLWINQTNGQSRAIKKFQLSDGLDPAIKPVVEDRWTNEIDMLSHQVESSFIVSALPTPADLLPVTGQLLSMEFCEGGDLRQILRRPENAAGLLEGEVRKVLTAVSGAITYLHSINIIHRDLKPENILRATSTVDGVYKLGDLGFAKGLIRNDSLSSTVVGTVQYLAPEVFLGIPYDITVDYWSFGIIAFEIITGMRPFLHGQPVTAWMPSVERKEDEVIAIYETSDGKRIRSKKFPFNTHLSERLKQCLEMWLKMMLQLDPKRRGRKIALNSSSTGGDEPIGLIVLRSILQVEMIDIFCPSKRLSFAIGNSTTMADVAGWIDRDIQVAKDDQVLFTSDGFLLPMCFKPLSAIRKNQNLQFFMIPKTLGVSGWMRVCTRLNLNLISKPAMLSTCTPFEERRVWAAWISHIRNAMSELNMIESAYRAIIACDRGDRVRLEGETKNIELNLKYLEGMMDLDKELLNVEMELNPDQLEQTPETMKLDEIRRDLENTIKLLRQLQPSTAPLSSANNRTMLDEMYDNVLRLYVAWRQGNESATLPAAQGLMDAFYARYHQYVSQESICLRTEFLEFLKLSDVSNSLGTASDGINSFKRNLLQRRCSEQRRLLKSLLDGNVLRNSDSITCTSNGPEGAEVEEMKSLMHESTFLENEVGEVLRRSMESIEEVRDCRQKLDWSFLEQESQ